MISHPYLARPPADITVECSSSVTPETLAYTDNCDGGGLVMSQDVSDGDTCPETITRSWTYTDACGNSTTVQQTITVNDITPPVFDAPPSSTTVSCTSEIPAIGDLGWTDNCDGSGSVIGTQVSDGATCPETITRTWTYTDACGNVSFEEQVIIVNDLIPPVFNTPPSDTTVSCDADVPPTQSLGWSDNCDGSGSVSGTDFDSGGSCPRTVTRTWTFTDACGNSATVQQIITISDQTIPVFNNIPIDVTVSCAANVPVLDNLDWTDNCDGGGFVPGNDVSDNGSCPEIITRTWTYTDACGNIGIAIQTITIHDLTLPVFDAPPADETVSCISDVSVMQSLGWTDDCDGSGSVAGSQVSDGASCPETITRTWTYTDACGNTGMAVQIIVVHDLEKPVFDVTPIDITVSCAVDVPGITDLGWTDNCDGNGSVTGMQVSDGASCPETITRTWTYTDACGNTGTAVQNIVIHDLIAPILNAPPAGTTVSCPADIPSIPLLGWTDNCDGSGSVLGTDVTDGASCPETITRTWTYTDGCGNVVSANQEIIVHDLVDPVFDAPPANITVACATDVPASIGLGWTDNCDGSGIEFGIDVITGTSCPFTVTRTWTYIDNCGNAATAEQIITIDENVPPVFDTPPVDISVECLPDPTSLGWNDNCDGAGSVMSTDVSNGGSCPEIWTRTWTYTDACDNTSSVSQTITTNDLTAPVVTCPPAITVNCPDEVPTPNVNSVIWTDNCGVVTVTWSGDDTTGFTFTGSDCPGYIKRTYIVTDECGNSTECTQNITISDKCDPGAQCPLCTDEVPFFFVDLTSDPDSSWLSPNVVRDGECCGETGPPPPRCIHFSLILPEETIAIAFEIISGAVPPGALWYEIGCGDEYPVGEVICLEGGQTYQLVFCEPGNNPNVYGITAYSGNVLPDTIISQVDCSNEFSIEGITESSVTWNDITGGGIYNSYLSCTSGCLTTTFTPDSNAPSVIYYEVCGDAGTVLCGMPFDICDTVVALVYPEIIVTVTPDPPIFCIDNIETLIRTIEPDGTYSTEWFNGPNGTGTLISTDTFYTPTVGGTYSVVVTDLVNSFFCNGDTANITVIINDLPIIELGPDTTICLNESVTFDLIDGHTYTWFPNTGVVEGADPSIFIVTPMTSTEYTVTVTSVDGCQATDVITINVLNCVLECPTQYVCSINDLVKYTTVTEFLNAGGDFTLPCFVNDNSITNISTVSDAGTCPEIITQEYAITDICGNAVTCNVISTINDTIAPIWLISPAAIGPLACDAGIPPHEVLTASDNCAYRITTSIDPYTEDYCNGYSVTLRWSLVDSCGNTAPDQIVIIDFEAAVLPVFSNAPGDSTISCEDIGNIIIPSLDYNNGQTGNCQIIGSIPGVLNGPIDQCSGTFTITWTYTDTCNSSVQESQTVTVTDNILPVIICPGGATYECMADLPAAYTDVTDFTDAGGTISDNCGINASSFSVVETSDGNSCPEVITRTYTIQDSCGNEQFCVQVFTIHDITSPIISCPGGATFECMVDVPARPTNFNDFISAGGSASDNCGLDLSTYAVTDVPDGNTCPVVITRTFSIEDSCGNSISCQQIIIVDDQIAPTISCPADIAIECILDLENPYDAFEFISDGGTLLDNCGVDFNSFSVVETNNGVICPRVITRTYTILDSCGNSASCQQVITIEDTTPPTMACPGGCDFRL